MGVYDLILEEDHDEVRRKISEAEAKSLTRTTRLGKDVLSKCVYVCTFMCNRHTSVCMYTRSAQYTGIHDTVFKMC